MAAAEAATEATTTVLEQAAKATELWHFTARRHVAALGHFAANATAAAQSATAETTAATAEKAKR
jgi:hypothetical protein